MGAPSLEIEGIPFHVNIVKPNGENVPYLKMVPEWITHHETENTDPKADAEMHNRFVENGGGKHDVSFTFAVDENCIWQNLELDQVGWQSGDGYYGTGNRKSVSIEICENGDKQKAIKNAQALTRWLMKELNLSIDRNAPHQKWSGKHCPDGILPNWDSYIEGIQNKKEMPKVNRKPVPKVVSSSVTGKRVESIYKGDEGLDFYISPSWNDKYKVGTFAFGMGWTIRKKLKVDGAYMYEVENSKGDVYYITAADKYVRVEGESKPKPKPPKPKKAWYIGKRAECKVAELRYYRKPSWSDKDVAGHLQEEYGFPKILGKVKVDGAYQYKVQNSKGAVYYVTASDKYITVE